MKSLSRSDLRKLTDLSLKKRRSFLVKKGFRLTHPTRLAEKFGMDATGSFIEKFKKGKEIVEHHKDFGVGYRVGKKIIKKHNIPTFKEEVKQFKKDTKKEIEKKYPKRKTIKRRSSKRNRGMFW